MSVADSDPKKVLKNRLGALFFVVTLFGYMLFIPQGIDLYRTTLEGCGWADCSPPELGPVILLAVFAMAIPMGVSLRAIRLPEQSPARKSLFPVLVWLHTLYLTALLGMMIFLPFASGPGGSREFVHLCFNAPVLLVIWLAAVGLFIQSRR
jgi:hypothetical protein